MGVISNCTKARGGLNENMLRYFIQRVTDSLFYSQEEISALNHNDQNGSKIETRSFTGRVTQYDRTTSSGMIDSSVYFDISVVIGRVKPQVCYIL